VTARQVTEPSGAPVTTNLFSYTVIWAAPVVTSVLPTNNAVGLGGEATFTASATGVPEPTYSWYALSAPGAVLSTSNTLTVVAASCAEQGKAFVVVVANSIAATTSGPVYLSITNSVLPEIGEVTPALSNLLNLGDSLLLSVTISNACTINSAGWTFNVTNSMVGWQSNAPNHVVVYQLPLTNVAYVDKGIYTLQVNNAAGTIDVNVMVNVNRAPLASQLYLSTITNRALTFSVAELLADAVTRMGMP